MIRNLTLIKVFLLKRSASFSVKEKTWYRFISNVLVIWLFYYDLFYTAPQKPLFGLKKNLFQSAPIRWIIKNRMLFHLLANNLYWNAEDAVVRKGRTFLDAINRGGKTKRNVEDTLTAIQTDVQRVVTVVSQLLTCQLCVKRWKD